MRGALAIGKPACRFDSLAATDTLLSRDPRSSNAPWEARRLHHPRALSGLPLIVLAEDNPQLRGLLASALELIGCRVVQAETGQRLVTIVQDLSTQGEAVRLVLTDVRMPTLGGFDAARALREAGHAMPLFFMTAYGDAWTRARAAELGATLFDKPLSLRALREAVRDALHDDG